MFDLSQTPMPFLAQALWPLAKRLTIALVAGLFVITSLVGWPTPVQAQAGLTPLQPITALNIVDQPAVPSPPINTNYSTPCDPGTFTNCPGAAVTLNFGAGVNRTLDSFEAGGLTLRRDTNLNEGIVFRRNLAQPFNRDVLFYENFPLVGAPPATINLQPELAAQIPAALLSPVVDRGVDNVFNNSQFNSNALGQGQDTRNNLERIDYIIRDGVVVDPAFQNQEGFLVLERVAPGGNDQFGIAAITSLDANGNPNGYGPLVQVSNDPNNWGTANQVQIPTVVFRRDDLADPVFRPSHTVPQQRVGGMFFPISSLLPAPQSNGRIFGYSLVAADVTQGGNALIDWNNPAVFPTGTGSGSAAGGLDLVAGGFGLFRVPRPPVPGNLFLNKRITQLTAAGNAIPFPGTEPSNNANNAGFPALVSAGLGQGTITVTTPELRPNDTVDYALYFNNTGETAVTNVQLCDQIPPGTSFISDTFGAGFGVQAIPPSNSQNLPVNYPTVNYTGASDGDPATFFPAGTPLPAICGADRGNGALVVNVGTVGPRQVGVIRFRTQVNPFLAQP